MAQFYYFIDIQIYLFNFFEMQGIISKEEPTDIQDGNAGCTKEGMNKYLPECRCMLGECCRSSDDCFILSH